MSPRSSRALVASVVAVVLAVPFASRAATVAGFAIDSNLRRQAAADDWADGPGGAGVIKGNRVGGACTQTGGDGVLICDDVKTDATTFPGGAKESDPSGWLPLKTSQVTPKTDITNVYAYGRVEGSRPYIFNGMERLPKAGDVHLDFEFNRRVAAGLPDRVAGDLLIAYDLGGSRNTNLDSISVRVFKARDGLGCGGACAGYDYGNPDATASGSGTVTKSGVTALMNTSGIAAGTWRAYDDHYNLVDTIPAFSFGEASIDVKTAAGADAVCVNWVTVKSRSSESVTSQLKDTTGPRRFPFCGGLHVLKYIDSDGDGSWDAGEPTGGAGWSFTVTGPAPSTDVACGGRTDATGELECSQLLPGEYTVTEAQRAGYASTDPGPYDAASPSKTVTVSANGNGGAEVSFGNAPYASIRGTKYKDADADGVRDAGEPGLAGFTIELSNGTSATSAADGSYSFASLEPGTYTVHEVGQAGWRQTEPASGDHTIQLGLTDVIADFGNTPLSDISVTFTPQTNATTATISCDDGTGAAQSGNGYTATDLTVGTYTCTVEIVDP